MRGYSIRIFNVEYDKRKKKVDMWDRFQYYIDLFGFFNLLFLIDFEIYN